MEGSSSSGWSCYWWSSGVLQRQLASSKGSKISCQDLVAGTRGNNTMANKTIRKYEEVKQPLRRSRGRSGKRGTAANMVVLRIWYRVLETLESTVPRYFKSSMRLDAYKLLQSTSQSLSALRVYYVLLLSAS